jgi:acetylglutamate kinase
MVLAGATNKRIVAAINSQGGQAVGLSGKDANLMICDKAMKKMKDPDSNIEKVLDLGFVGEPTEVNPHVLHTFLESDLIPVIAPVGAGRSPQETFNVNGDTAAGAIAGALRAERLMLLTDVQGVKNKNGEVLTQLSAEDVRNLINDGTIAGGMIPKVETALYAVEKGCGGAVILDGTTPHGLLLELFTRHGAGTLIVG